MLALNLKHGGKDSSFLQKDGKIVVFKTNTQAHQAIVRLYDNGYISQNDIRYISVIDIDELIFCEKLEYSEGLLEECECIK